MSAKTADNVIQGRILEYGEYKSFPVAASETIYAGVFAVVNKSGYLQNATADTLKEAALVVLTIDSQASSTTAGSISGDTETGENVVRAFTAGEVRVEGSGFAQSDVGKTAYITNNWDATIDPTAGRKIGTITKFISSTVVYVDLNKYYGLDGTVVYQGALTAVTGTTAGGMMAWANPTGETILVEDLILDVTTKSTGAATVDVGVAADATTSSDTIYDGLDVGTAAILANATSSNGGTNGKLARKMTSSQYITGTASATLAGLVGTYTVKYRVWE